MTNKELIENQAKQILELQRKLTRLEGLLRGYQGNAKPKEKKQTTQINEKRKQLPSWVRNLLD